VPAGLVVAAAPVVPAAAEVVAKVVEDLESVVAAPEEERTLPVVDKGTVGTPVIVVGTGRAVVEVTGRPVVEVTVVEVTSRTVAEEVVSSVVPVVVRVFEVVSGAVVVVSEALVTSVLPCPIASAKSTLSSTNITELWKPSARLWTLSE
jgi:hypothetical protein